MSSLRFMPPPLPAASSTPLPLSDGFDPWDACPHPILATKRVWQSGRRFLGRIASPQRPGAKRKPVVARSRPDGRSPRLDPELSWDVPLWARPLRTEDSGA
jgi:hypothetical protein